MVDKFRYYWDNSDESRFVIALGTGWTWQDYVAIIDEIHAIIAKKNHDVNLIMDWQASLPPGKDAMSALKHSGGTQPPNLRHTVMVNKSTRFLDILVKNTDRKEGWVGPKIVQNLDDAREYLETLD